MATSEQDETGEEEEVAGKQKHQDVQQRQQHGASPLGKLNEQEFAEDSSMERGHKMPTRSKMKTTSDQNQEASVDEANIAPSTQSNSEERQTSRRDSARLSRADQRQQQRSRSRGRTPSELLARKQQLLMTNGSGSGGSQLAPTTGTATNLPSLSSGSNQQDEDDVVQLRQQQQQQSAEAKLESLSVLLKTHQVASADASHDSQSDINLNELAARQQQHSLKSIDDVYILLAKKEKDLQLAAELGKVLLERNDELSKANERIAEEYSRKLELLEQEKHKLKRKLDLLDGEYENRIIELQTDSNILKNKLEQQQQASKQAEREKSKLIDDLVQQNQRLTSELAEATKSEELLSSQLEQLNDRLNARPSNRSDHVAQVDALQDEILVLNKRKQDLERRLKLAQNEKANLVATLDETGDKVLLLENLLNEKDLKIGELAIEISELRDSSSWLSVKLESMISLNERLIGYNQDEQQQQHESGGHKVDELRAMSERERSHLVEQLKDLRLKRNSRIKANEMILQSAAERQRRSLSTGIRRSALNGGSKRSRPRRHLLFASNNNGECDDDDDGNGSLTSDNRGEVRSPSPVDNFEATNDLIIELYKIFSDLYGGLLRRKERLLQAAANGGNDSNYTNSLGGGSGNNQSSAMSNGQASADTNGTAHLNDDSGIGSAEEITTTPDGSKDGAAPQVDLAKWRQLVDNLRQLIEEMPCTSCQLMIAERADYEQLRKLHTRVCDEIRLKNDELLQCNAENIEIKAKLSALEERCQLIQGDLDNCDKPKEEIVRLAWKARDEAVGRKNNAEIQLAKTRIENMQISSQLMEVVQQKGELSQKLAQFEDDIHYMMQRSVHARFSWEQYADETRRLAGSRTGQRQANTGNQSNGQAIGGAASSLQQLLSLSSIALLSPKRSSPQSATSTQLSSQAKSPISTSSVTSGEQQPDSISGTTSNLLANLKSSRFNLRFWQKSAVLQEPDSGDQKH